MTAGECRAILHPLAKIAAASEDWELLTRFLPDGWREQARATGALQRARVIRDADTLLRSLLVHLALGCSLRETAARVSASGLVEVSDVALWKRLKGSGEWFRWLSEGMLKRMGIEKRDRSWAGGYRIMLVDASVVCEPGSTGADWRLHYSILLESLQCNHFEITDTSGGETFKRFPVKRGDLIMGDRGYAQPPGIRHVSRHGADTIVRLNLHAVPLQTPKGARFDFLSRLRRLKIGEVGEWNAVLPGAKPTSGGLAVRVCALKKSEEAAEKTRKKVRRIASRKGQKLKPETLEAAGYVMVLTTTTSAVLPAARVLDIYRARWQIELAFKRMKSIIGLGHLPKIDEDSARAWLHGKLFVSLLTEAIINEAESFSPWGYPIGGSEREDSFALA